MRWRRVVLMRTSVKTKLPALFLACLHDAGAARRKRAFRYEVWAPASKLRCASHLIGFSGGPSGGQTFQPMRRPDFSANAAALPSCPRQRMEPVHELTMRCEKAGLHSTQTTDSSCDPARVCKALKRPRPLVSRLCADCEQVPETPEAKAKAHQPPPRFLSGSG